MSGDDPREPAYCRGDWVQHYAHGELPWDLGRAPPCLEALVARAPAGLRVFVPGAGRGHDAICWAAGGHAVTACDIVPQAVDEARALGEAAGVDVDWRVADVLALPAGLHGAFDVVWEQTCLCALPPADWPRYVDAMASVLVPDGVYHGLFWNHGVAGGPPWDVTEEKALAVLGARFRAESSETVPPWSPERWNEFLLTMRRVA